MLTHTAGSTPFRFSLHQGDVGHALIVGPTGAGKSVLLNFMALQFRRYLDTQVYFFDKGSSARGSSHLARSRSAYQKSMRNAYKMESP
jgi:type IV secretion system protein VirB4